MAKQLMQPQVLRQLGLQVQQRVPAMQASQQPASKRAELVIFWIHGLQQAARTQKHLLWPLTSPVPGSHWWRCQIATTGR